MIIILHIVVTIINICFALISIKYLLEGLTVKQVGISDRGAMVFVSSTFLLISLYNIYWIWFL